MSSKSLRFGTLYWFHLHGHVDDLPLKMELIEGSKTPAFRTQSPGNYPKENILRILYHFIPYDQIVIDSRHCNRFCFYTQKVLLVDTNCFLDTFNAPNSIIICMTDSLLLQF